MEILSTLKRTQLQKLCKENDLKASGKNSELIQNLSKVYETTGTLKGLDSFVHSNSKEEIMEKEDKENKVCEEQVPDNTVFNTPPNTPPNINEFLNDANDDLSVEAHKLFQELMLSPKRGKEKENEQVIKKNEKASSKELPKAKKVEKVSSISKISKFFRPEKEVKQNGNDLLKQKGKNKLETDLQKQKVSKPIKNEKKPEEKINIKTSATVTEKPKTTTENIKANPAHGRERSRTLSHVDLPKPVSNMKRSKSQYFHPKTKFENAHQNAFQKMDSIANHYAAKRSHENLKSTSHKPAEEKKRVILFSAPLLNQKLRHRESKSSEDLKLKKKFDLKASLARPLSYKPYTGKLKPLEESKNFVGAQLKRVFTFKKN